MPTTIAEIAEATGFSRTTISMVLRGRATKYRISERTQKIIMDYVQERDGYTINQTARNLKMKRSYTIGFVVPDLANAFFSRLMANLEEFCRAEGLVLVTTSSLEDPNVETRALNSLMERGVDGLIVAPCSPRDYHELINRGPHRTPIVLVDRYYANEGIPFISSNHRESAQKITGQIIANQCDSVTFLCGHPDNPSIKDRIIGFNNAARESGLDPDKATVLALSGDTAEVGKDLADQLLDRGPLPSAILCSSLLVLEGALQQIKARTGAISPDLTIGTFDFDGLLELLPNTILAVEQNETGLAREIFNTLSQQINGESIADQKKIISSNFIFHPAN